MNNSKKEKFEYALLNLNPNGVKNIKEQFFEMISSKKAEAVDFFLPLTVENKQSDEIINMARASLKMTFEGYNQRNNHHSYALFEHLLYSVINVNSSTNDSNNLKVQEDLISMSKLENPEIIRLKVAAFFHDIAKPIVKKYDILKRKKRFPNHEEESAKLAELFLKELGYSTEEINEIIFFIRHHGDFVKLRMDTETSNESIKINILNISNILKSQLQSDGSFKPTLHDIELLLILCVAESKAQSPFVFEHESFKPKDTMENVINRLNEIYKLLPEAFNIAMR